jgi:hypothetical protein
MKLQDTHEHRVPEGMTELDLTLEFEQEEVGQGPAYALHCGNCGHCGHCGGCRCGGCRCGCCGGCGGCRSEPTPLPTGEGDTKPTGFALLVAPAKG